MEWYENSAEEKRVFLLQRSGETRSDWGQDLKKLRQSVVRLDIVLVDNLEEHVHDWLLDVVPKSHEFAVNAVQDGL